MARPNLSEHTRERIVVAAVAVIDRDGMPALSTRRLAESLGIAGPTLYHYFARKDDLLDAVTQHLSAEIRASVKAHLATADATSAGDVLRAYARGALAALRAHPHAIEFLALRPIANRATLESYDAMLARLTAAGWPLRLAWQAYLAAENLVLSGALEGSAAAFAPGDELVDGLAHVRDVVAMLRAEPELDDAFEFGLEALIAGIEARAGDTP